LLTTDFQLHNVWADAAKYHDICLKIYMVADFRGADEIRAVWVGLLEEAHVEAQKSDGPEPYEFVAESIRNVAEQVNSSEDLFPVEMLLPLLKRYAFEEQRDAAQKTWVIDLFLDLNVPYEVLLDTLEKMIWNDEAPFKGNNRRFISKDLYHVIDVWYTRTIGSGGGLFGSDFAARSCLDLLELVLKTGAGVGDSAREEQEVVQLRDKIRKYLA
jgi:nuclear pore complex protein Nup155